MLACLRFLLLVGIGLTMLLGCQQPAAPPPDVVARVGEYRLTEHELNETLEPLPVGRDTSNARKQVIERWITNTLLYRAALQRGLAEKPAVQQRLKESRRSVLISTLMDSLLSEAAFVPSKAQMRAYFEQHHKQMRLREPFIWVRHLAAASRGAADSARAALQDATQQAAADSLWPTIARQWAMNPQRALTLAGSYYSERNLFAHLPRVRAVLDQLEPGEVASVFKVGNVYHVLQLVERFPAGTLPKLSWMKDQVQRRLRLEHRKQIYARQVQRLRNEARAQGDLEVYLNRPDE